MPKRIVEFLRKKDLIFVEELGQGACGKTVVLYDEIIDETFVCKKYSPRHEQLKEELFSNFVQEIKLLHLLNHPNVVRVFNYYLYPELLAGYILMEKVNGLDIEEYLNQYPENINQVFNQVVNGFEHLERNNILHRDIRPQNILVSNDGEVKIIDFGFGKQAFSKHDFGKSISLNWWCEPPQEFSDQIYNYTTEVYFVGKLFEKLIVQNQIEKFSYRSMLSRMCQDLPDARIKSFASIKNEMLAGKLTDIEFTESELQAYRNFAASISEILSKIEKNAKYYDSPDDVLRKLDDCYKKVMLEEYVPNNSSVLRCLLNGAYYYSNRDFMAVEDIRKFLELLRSCSREKGNIVIRNIYNRIDAISRYEQETDFNDIDPF